MTINQIKAGATLSYISMGLGYSISLAYTPIMLRLLGQNEYGLYNLVASVVAYIGLLSFGFGSAYIRYYSRYKVNEDNKNIARLNGMFLIIFSFIGIIALLAGMVLVLNVHVILGAALTSKELATAKILIGVMVFNLSIAFPNVVFDSYVVAQENFVFQKALQIVKMVSNPFVVLPVLLMGYGSIGMVIATTIMNITLEFINIIYCRKKLDIQFSFQGFDLSLMKEMTIFSSYIFINLVVDQVNWNVDKFILGRIHGTTSVAIYGLASQLNTYYLSLSTAISNVFIPRIHKLVSMSNSNDELIALFTKVGRIQFLLLSLVSTGFIFFGRYFINLWAGGNYDKAYLMALILIIPVTIPLIQNIGIEIQKAKNMHQFRSWLYLFIAIVNVILTIPLAQRLQGTGAAIGTALAIVIGNGFIMNWYYHTKVGLDMKYFWKHILQTVPSLGCPVIFGFIINQTCNLYIMRNFVAGGISYFIIYCLSMWFFGMNQYEKDLIGKPIIKTFRKISDGINIAK